MRTGVALGGSWCCSSSTLWCATCAANLAYSGLEDEVSDKLGSGKAFLSRYTGTVS